MKRLGSTRAAALLGITGGAAVLAAILRWVQLSNDIKSNGAVLQGRYLYLVIAALSVTAHATPSSGMSRFIVFCSCVRARASSSVFGRDA